MTSAAGCRGHCRPEPGVAAFVRDVAPVTDDRTVLDFAIPRSLGSGFGLGTFNMKATVGGRNPFSEAFERERYYLGHRNSAVPLLRNLGTDTPETIAARIAERSKIVVPQRVGEPRGLAFVSLEATSRPS